MYSDNGWILIEEVSESRVRISSGYSNKPCGVVYNLEKMTLGEAVEDFVSKYM